MSIPRDPIMLLSFVNTQLRDHYPSLQEFCQAYMTEQKDIEAALAAVDYHYDADLNKFV